MANLWRRVAANVKSTGWSTATAADCNVANAGLLVTDIPAKLERPPEQAISPGQIAAGHSYRSIQTLAFDLTMPWQYVGGCPILFGAAHGDATVSGSGPYSHLFSMPGTSGLMGRIRSLAWREIVAGGGSPTYRYYEIFNARVWKWKLSGSIPGPVMLTLSIIGDTIDRDATTNTSFASTTFPADDELQWMKGDIFEIADQGSDPASLGINAFELECGIEQQADHVTGSTEYVAEPHDAIGDRGWKGTLKVTRPRKDVKTYEQDYDAGTAKNATLIFAGNNNNTMTIKLPKLDPSDHDAPEVAEDLTYDILADFDSDAHANATPATATHPYDIVVVNDYASAYDVVLT